MPKHDTRIPVLNRALQVRADSLDEEKRTVDLIFATETPAPMWHWDIGDYDEILVCSEGACDLKRLRMGGALLREHDRGQQIGVIESAKFENGVGIATARFSKNALGEQEFQDVKAGIRRNFSVSYQVKELTAEKVSDEDGSVYRATSWEPLEISLVSVPADVNCQALRSADKPTGQPFSIQIPKTIRISETMKRSLKFFESDNGGNATTGSTTVTPPAPKIDAEAERAKIRADLLKRDRDIDEAADSFRKANRPVDDLAKRAKAEDWDINKFRTEAIKLLATQEESKANTPSGIEVISNEVPRNVRSIGEQFVGSDAYKAFKLGTTKRSHAHVIPNAVSFRATGLTSTITSYSGIVQAPGPITLGVQQATVADLMAQGTTTLTAVPYLREDTLTPAATSVTEEGQKPEASWDWSQTSAPVVKIAVIGRVTDELFEDVPAMQSYIDQRLRYMVEIEEDDQLLNGNGGGDLTGIINTANVNTQALGALSKPDAIRKGITKVQSTGFFRPDGIVMHPNDFEEIALLKDANGQYLGGGPFYAPYGNGQYVSFERVWGLPTVVTTSCPEGTAIVGAWKLGAMIFRKKGLTLESTNSDASDFQYNRIAIRAEERLALAVFRPKAFTLVTGI